MAQEEKITVEDLIDLVREIDSEDPIDWGMLNIDESAATEMLANSILEQYQQDWQRMSDRDRTLIMMATITKLVVENFTLNLKLTQKV
jgi:hypothetical protein